MTVEINRKYEIIKQIILKVQARDCIMKILQRGWKSSKANREQ